MATVGSGLNILGAYGDSTQELRQTSFTGDVPRSLQTLGGWFGSQAAPDAMAAKACGAQFATPVYVTAGKWWHQLQQHDTQQPEYHDSEAERNVAATPASESTAQQASIRLESVDIVTPRGQAVCSNLSCRINQGESLMVTGSNASGKTSLVRTLAGLWPVRQGAISLDFPPPDSDQFGVPSTRQGRRRQQLFVLPQRIFMTLGSLSDQVT